MAIIGQDQGLVIPAVGTAGTTYATQINTALAAIETVLETALTQESINITDDLSMGGYSLAATSMIKFQASSDTPVDNSVYVSGGELYFKNGSSQALQITSGGSLNAASLGGIGDDYGSTNAQARYDDSTTTYFFQSDYTADTGCKVAVGSLALTGLTAGDMNFPLDTGDGATEFRRTSGGTNHAITFPNALPAGQRAIQVNASGTVTYENSFAGGLTVEDSGLTVTSGGLTVTAGGATVTAGGLTVTAGNVAISSGTLTSSGALTVSSGGAAITGTCAVSGTITATGNIVATGEVLWSGTRTQFIPVTLATQAAGDGAGNEGLITSGAGVAPYRDMDGNITSETNAIYFPISLRDGESISQVHVYYSVASGSHTIVGRIVGGPAGATASVTSSSLSSSSVTYTTQAHVVAGVQGQPSTLTNPAFTSYAVWHTSGTASNFYLHGIAVTLTAG